MSRHVVLQCVRLVVTFWPGAISVMQLWFHTTVAAVCIMNCKKLGNHDYRVMLLLTTHTHTRVRTEQARDDWEREATTYGGGVVLYTSNVHGKILITKYKLKRHQMTNVHLKFSSLHCGNTQDVCFTVSKLIIRGLLRLKKYIKTVCRALQSVKQCRSRVSQ